MAHHIAALLQHAHACGARACLDTLVLLQAAQEAHLGQLWALGVLEAQVSFWI